MKTIIDPHGVAIIGEYTCNCCKADAIDMHLFRCSETAMTTPHLAGTVCKARHLETVVSTLQASWCNTQQTIQQARRRASLMCCVLTQSCDKVDAFARCLIPKYGRVKGGQICKSETDVRGCRAVILQGMLPCMPRNNACTSSSNVLHRQM